MFNVFPWKCQHDMLQINLLENSVYVYLLFFLRVCVYLLVCACKMCAFGLHEISRKSHSNNFLIWGKEIILFVEKGCIFSWHVWKMFLKIYQRSMWSLDESFIHTRTCWKVDGPTQFPRIILYYRPAAYAVFSKLDMAKIQSDALHECV